MRNLIPIAVAGFVVALCIMNSYAAEKRVESKSDQPSETETNMKTSTHNHKNLILQTIIDAEPGAGERIDLKLVLTNKRENKIQYSYGRLPKGFLISITNEKGQPVSLTAWGERYFGEAAISSPVNKRITEELEPNESISLDINLSRFFDLSVPGTYLVAIDWPSDPSDPNREAELKIRNLELQINESD